MFNTDLIVLSYHRFGDTFSEYPFSRTLDQFRHDLTKKVYDLVTIDDGRDCCIRACDIMRELNIRAKIFITTGLVGTPGYCTWEDIRRLSKFHDIENHSHHHKDHTLASYELQFEGIQHAQKVITAEIGRPPRYFVPPYNKFNPSTEMAAMKLELILVKNRITIKNDTK